MNTIINFLKDINGNALYFVHRVKAYLNIDIDTMATLIIAIIFGIPFVAMIVYAVVLHRRGKKMGVIYNHGTVRKIDNEFWEPADRDLFLDPMYDGMPGSLSDYADNDPQNPEYRYN